MFFVKHLSILICIHYYIDKHAILIQNNLNNLLNLINTGVVVEGADELQHPPPSTQTRISVVAYFDVSEIYKIIITKQNTQKDSKHSGKKDTNQNKKSHTLKCWN